MYENDKRIVLTLDAGGTNMVFGAIKGNKEIVESYSAKTETDDLDKCLKDISDGFSAISERLDGKPDAISFAFPGPADYENGIIGDLPNFSCFRGNVPLGSFLSERFHIPVFINNDGNLYALGEAKSGFLQKINATLTKAGKHKKYKNIIGVTLGTGFGAGVVIDGHLLKGDNGCGGDVWLMRNRREPGMIAEESVSIRAVQRVYSTISGDTKKLSPKEIFEIAEGNLEGDRAAALESFASLGRGVADAIITALDIIDGLVVIGGGVAGAYKFIFPAMKETMNEKFHTFAGLTFPCVQMRPFFIDCEDSLKRFIEYEGKKTAIGLSSADTSKVIWAGAYAYAIEKLDQG